MRKLILGLCLLAFSCSGAVVSNMTDIGTSTFKTVNASGTVTASNFVGSAAGLNNFAVSTNTLWLSPSKGHDATAVIGDINRPASTWTNAMLMLQTNANTLTNGFLVVMPGESVYTIDATNKLATGQTLSVFAYGASVSAYSKSNMAACFTPTTNDTLWVEGGQWDGIDDAVGVGTVKFLSLDGACQGPGNTITVKNITKPYHYPSSPPAGVDWVHTIGPSYTNLINITFENVTVVSNLFDCWFLNLTTGQASNSLVTLRNCHFLADSAGTTTANGIHILGGVYRIENCTFEGYNAFASAVTSGIIIEKGAQVTWINSWAHAGTTNGGTVGSVNFKSTPISTITVYGQMCPTNEILTPANAVITYANDYQAASVAAGAGFFSDGGGQISLDTTLRQFYDSLGGLSMDYSARTFYDASVVQALNTSTRNLKDTGGTINSVRWGLRQLIGTNSAVRLDWSGNTLSGDGSGLTNLNAASAMPVAVTNNDSRLGVLSSTNIAPLFIQTNFVSGQVYTNFYGAPLQLMANIQLTLAAVAGDAAVDLWTNGVLMFRVGNQTTSSTVATTNEVMMVGIIPTGATYSLTNKITTGSGNSTAVLGGQLIVW